MRSTDSPDPDVPSSEHSQAARTTTESPSVLPFSSADTLTSSQNTAVPLKYRYRPPSDNTPKKRTDYGLANFATVLCGVAVAFEGLFHICAILGFDPIPHPLVTVLYVLVVFMMGFNQCLLYAEGKWWKGLRASPRAISLALVASVVSLLVALSAAFMFFSPFALFGILALVFGVGFLILTPYWAVITLLFQIPRLIRLWQETGASRVEVGRTAGATTLATLALLFWLIGRPMFGAQYAALALLYSDSESEIQQEVIEKLRLFGGETILLDIAYNRNPSYWACLGFNAPEKGWYPWNGYEWRGSWYGNNTEKARRLYFLATGKPFEHVPPPTSYQHSQGRLFGGPSDVAIEETGGMRVGRKVEGLWLKASQMDAQTIPQADATTLDWTLRFRNDTNEPQEARADILIPEDAVVHKVSLWINGEERFARYGHPDRVRKAYQEVAVVQRRDPLLVTLPAPGHILAQCFPVQPHDEMQIRLGFTLPARQRPTVGNTLGYFVDTPAFGEVNFAVPASTQNQLTIKTEENASPVRRETLKRDQLFHPMGVALDNFGFATLNPDTGQPIDLYIVRDASAGMNSVFSNATLQALENALNTLPKGSRVRFLNTVEPQIILDWTPGTTLPPRFLQKQFSGGTDPEPALAEALQQAQASPRPVAVVFLYAATPFHVSDLSTIRPVLQKDYWDGPLLVGLQMVPQMPDALFTGLGGFPTVSNYRVYANEADTESRLRAALGQIVYSARGNRSGVTEAQAVANDFRQGKVPQYTSLVEGFTGQKITLGKAEHERLTLFSTVVLAWQYANTLPEEEAMTIRIPAGKAAARAKLVTPLSSAVVLETEEQYKKNGLEEEKNKDGKPADTDNFVSPEPSTVALVVIGLFGMLGVRKRSALRRQHRQYRQRCTK